jgi:hypothetical protein
MKVLLGCKGESNTDGEQLIKFLEWPNLQGVQTKDHKAVLLLALKTIIYKQQLFSKGYSYGSFV